MQQFEKDYAHLIDTILGDGEVRHTRNGETRSMFGMNLTVDVLPGTFPIIQGRKMYYEGVLGELAAMLRKPTKLEDFEKWGCNYWKLWAKADGSINVDYGNAWHADGQIEHLKYCLRNNPTDRRMIISGWRPHKLKDLDLPCCHLMYQFYVRDGVYLDMIWTQRSADMMIGVPSDIIFAAAWLRAIAKEFGLVTGKIHMNFGDCHVYAEHYDQATEYVLRVNTNNVPPVIAAWNGDRGKDFCEFEPTDLHIIRYTYLNPMKLELKA